MSSPPEVFAAAEVVGVVDDRGEEINALDEGEIVAQP
jgi:hypothetical protein